MAVFYIKKKHSNKHFATGYTKKVLSNLFSFSTHQDKINFPNRHTKDMLLHLFQQKA